MQSSRKDPLSRPLYVCLIAAVACLLWGSATPMIKRGYALFSIADSDTASILLFAGCRFALAGILVILYASLTQHRFALPQKNSWGNVFKLSWFQTTGHYLLFYIGVANCSGVHSAILTGCSYLWAILLACFALHQEKMTLPKLIGCLLGFGGILVMNLTGAGGGVTFLGEGFVLLSGICGGMSSCLARVYSRTERPTVLTGWQFLMGGVILMACGLIAGGHLAFTSWAAAGVLGYLGMLSAVAYTLWTVLMAHNKVSSVAVYGFMTPLFGVLLSAVLLGEGAQAFSLNTLIALIMVCGAIAIVNRFGDH